MEFTSWPYSVDRYELFRLVQDNPRIPKAHIARKFRVNEKTGTLWWDAAVKKRIIIPPIFRRKSFLNFREYFYFIKVKDPHYSYLSLRTSKDIIYCSVHTGFSDIQVISKKPLNLKGEVVLSGDRSDYYVSTPLNCSFSQAVSTIEKKLKNIDSHHYIPSPLVFRTTDYEPWDDLDEVIFWELCNDVRKPFSRIVKTTGAYSDKILKWFRKRNEFGHTFTMFFPRGEGSYQLTLYAVETEEDSLLIDIFSKFPTSSVFYRVDKYLMMVLYVSFPYIARSLVRNVLSSLQKKELIGDYINSIAEYSYHPD